MAATYTPFKIDERLNPVDLERVATALLTTKADPTHGGIVTFARKAAYWAEKKAARRARVEAKHYAIIAARERGRVIDNVREREEALFLEGFFERLRDELDPTALLVAADLVEPRREILDFFPEAPATSAVRRFWGLSENYIADLRKIMARVYREMI